MEVVEQLDGYHFDARWLVHASGMPRVVWVIDHYHQPWFAETAAVMAPWCGPIDPRVSTVYAARAHDRALLLEVDDDRGPMLHDAAAQLAGAERERWVVSQIIALCDGLTALRTRDRTFVYERLNPERIFIDVAGHARLRAPFVHVYAPPTSRTGGADLNIVRYLAPEQLTKRPAMPASEVFGLAGNLYLALSGRRPFESEASMAEMMRIIQSKSDPIDVHTPELARVLDRAFVKEPTSRIPDPATLAAELRACVPDAADYDAVISDRIVPWRANLPKPAVHPESMLSPAEIVEALR